MTCQEFVDFILAYLEAELPAGERASFEEHLHECPECVDYLDTYRDTIRLGRLCEPPDPEEVPESLVQAILATRPARKP